MGETDWTVRNTHAVAAFRGGIYGMAGGFEYFRKMRHKSSNPVTYFSILFTCKIVTAI